jgi:hypothetical protein
MYTVSAREKKNGEESLCDFKRKLTSVVHVSVHRGAGLFPSLD